MHLAAPAPIGDARRAGVRHVDPLPGLRFGTVALTFLEGSGYLLHPPNDDYRTELPDVGGRAS